MKTLLVATNRHTKTLAIMPDGVCWEQLQGMSRVGIALGDCIATGIGRVNQSRPEFELRVKREGWRIVE